MGVSAHLAIIESNLFGAYKCALIKKSGGISMTDKQMESKIYQIELLNEFSMSVYNRLLRHVHKNKIDLTHQAHQENFIVLLFHQLEETLSLNLFKKELKELEEIKHYWITMNSLTKEICASDVQTD